MAAAGNAAARASLSEVTAGEWEALASRRIFFGHQSVGRDMVAGIRDLLAEHQEIDLRLVSSDDPRSVDGPAFMEAKIGLNRQPETKARAFAEVVEKGLGPRAIAMLKYCYVDVDMETDIDALFDAYLTQVQELERAHPDLLLVHITLPLRKVPAGAMERVKSMLGASREVALNRKRNRYNDRLRQEFGDKGTLFDLALLESTRPDGSRAFTRQRSGEVYMLAPEWTHDRGHLNEAGRRYVAEQFLIMLARLAVLHQATGSPVQAA